MFAVIGLDPLFTIRIVFPTCSSISIFSNIQFYAVSYVLSTLIWIIPLASVEGGISLISDNVTVLSSNNELVSSM
jgi:hypothetical protein